VFKTGESVTVEVANGTNVVFTSNGTQTSNLTVAPDSDSIQDGTTKAITATSVTSSLGTLENPAVLNAGTLTINDSINTTTVTVGNATVNEDATSTTVACNIVRSCV
jgi:hypothetical protein